MSGTQHNGLVNWVGRKGCKAQRMKALFLGDNHKASSGRSGVGRRMKGIVWLPVTCACALQVLKDLLPFSLLPRIIMGCSCHTVADAAPALLQAFLDFMPFSFVYVLGWFWVSGWVIAFLFPASVQCIGSFLAKISPCKKGTSIEYPVEYCLKHCKLMRMVSSTSCSSIHSPLITINSLPLHFQLHSCWIILSQSHHALTAQPNSKSCRWNSDESMHYTRGRQLQMQRQ